LFEGSTKNPFFFVFLILLVSTIVYLPIVLKSGKYGRAFLTSSLLITAMLGQMALSLFPRLVPSSINLAYSLTIYNASSSQMTLQTMLIIALIGVPIVIAYSALIHYIFRGKVELTEESY
jgi:cytochrome d ubiquinol oxidase subunit II